ncbi:MAG: hypothetical protein NVSMB6_20380 [Burkholderiaceae bacterium]
MESKYYQRVQQMTARAVTWLRTAIDATATWVTQLSWRKFFLFALLLMIGGSILEDTPFTNQSGKVVTVRGKHAPPHTKSSHGGAQQQSVTDGGTSIRIDAEGLHVTTSSASEKGSIGASKNIEGDTLVGAPARASGDRSEVAAVPIVPPPPASHRA